MNLGTQLGAGVLLMVLVTILHGAGIVVVTKLLNLEEQALKSRALGIGAFGLMTSVAIALFLLHAVEIALFAAFYLAVAAIDTVEAALFVSASNYATLGQGVDEFPTEWRLVAAMEGVTGFLLLGWSTAVFVTDMNHLLRNKGRR
jgi:hypothetical protein